MKQTRTWAIAVGVGAVLLLLFLLLRDPQQAASPIPEGNAPPPLALNPAAPTGREGAEPPSIPGTEQPSPVLDSPSPAPLDAGVATAAGDELPLLAPTLRRSTLMVAGPAVIACLAETGLPAAKLDPSIHGRLHVVSGPDGKARVARVEIVNGDRAPPELTRCATRLLERLALDLPSGSEGLVITPPFSGKP